MVTGEMFGLQTDTLVKVGACCHLVQIDFHSYDLSELLYMALP